MSRPSRAARVALVMTLAALAAGAPPLAAEESARRPAWLEAVDRRTGDVVSPHALSRAHAELEGISRCTDCHDGLRGTPDGRCLDCHDDVAARMQARAGWHGQLTDRCASCHVEHRGREGDLLGFDRDAWNHELAAFPLRGAHVEVACDDCHRREGRDGAVGFHAQGIASSRCADCHSDVHGPELLAERDCGVCHTERSFRAEALVTRGFDHARDAGFALEGAHAKAACGLCHDDARRAAEQSARLAPGSSAPRDCAGCHEDPHAGALGAACAGCHDTRSWQASADAPSFDHARDTRFPLDTLHAKLACSSCHEGLGFAAAGRECADCHATAAALLAGDAGMAKGAPDPHALSVRCRDCHAESVAAPRLLDYERTCLACHPAPYAALLVTRKRIVDEAVVKVEAALRGRELARRRGETDASAERDAALAAGVARIAKSGLHHATLSESALLAILDSLTSAEAPLTGGGAQR